MNLLQRIIFHSLVLLTFITEQIKHPNQTYKLIMEAKRKSRFDMSHLMQDMDLYNKALDEVIRIERGEYFRSYQINFKVHFESKYGDKIVVVGNLPQLGAWNPA